MIVSLALSRVAGRCNLKILVIYFNYITLFNLVMLVLQLISLFNLCSVSTSIVVIPFPSVFDCGIKDIGKGI